MKGVLAGLVLVIGVEAWAQGSITVYNPDGSFIVLAHALQFKME